MKLEDFADISDCLRGGIFVLLYRGEVVYVGKASRAMLGTISNLRSKNLPSWMGILLMGKHTIFTLRAVLLEPMPTIHFI